LFYWLCRRAFTIGWIGTNHRTKNLTFSPQVFENTCAEINQGSRLRVLKLGRQIQ
jgi:hypothetical protein